MGPASRFVLVVSQSSRLEGAELAEPTRDRYLDLIRIYLKHREG